MNEASSGDASERAVFAGPYTARVEGPFVVFLIGMQWNDPRAWRTALRAFLTMPKMLVELARDPSLGYLGGSASFGWARASIVQYWRSFEALEAFAASPASSHLAAWRWFNGIRASSPGVGVWHETYRIAPGDYEAIYVNMPRTGLAAAGEHLAVVRARRTARERLAS